MTKLQQARKAKGLTVFEVAVRAGMDPSTISRIERGVQECRREKAVELATVLEVDLLEVIFNKPKEAAA